MISSILEQQIKNFSQLSNEECALIIKNNLLEALESDLYIDWEIVAKFIMTPYADREALCKILNSSIRKNIQLIGNFTISDWIRKYQDQYLGKERNPNTFFEYVNNNPEVKKLSKKDQLKLARILRIYDYLLVIPIADLDGPVSNILRFSMQSESTPEEKLAQSKSENLDQFIPQKITLEKLSISEALKKFPEIGEQLITSTHIKLKSFPEPVRPSINNWLSDYTFNLGFESHSAMDRGTYLFRNENAKVLNSTDREKISYILKAYDENSLVDVNVNTKQVVFPKREQAKIISNFSAKGGSASGGQYPISNKISNNEISNIKTPTKSQFQEIYNAKKQTEQPKDIFKEERIATENRNAGNINFSSPQRMPYEKQTIQPIQPQKPAPAPQPMRISSQNLRNNSDKPRTNPNVPTGNIVNLKDKQ